MKQHWEPWNENNPSTLWAGHAKESAEWKFLTGRFDGRVSVYHDIHKTREPLKHHEMWNYHVLNNWRGTFTWNQDHNTYPFPCMPADKETARWSRGDKSEEKSTLRSDIFSTKTHVRTCDHARSITWNREGVLCSSSRAKSSYQQH